ncbi:uncharacterized protein L201_007346 [Kwoniella dendrophila CBS 6074]|uniref:Uncharacterized protein n=1 Tax=Kwoniella dendrophila CBS 6074 TaxID=1295534 RepID=A0AAX4K5I5_9TREE
MSGPPPIPSAGLSPVLPVQPFAGSSFPPPVPPNDTFTPSVTNKSGIRRLYNLFKRAKSDTGSKNGKNKGIIRKIKGLFASLKLKKKVNVDPSSNVLAINQSSNTENEDGTNDGIAQPATTSPETTAQPHQNEAQTSHQSAQEMGKAQNETSISPADSTDLFHQAVIDAQKRADRLGSTTQILRVLAEGLTVGAATWMPGVGEAASMVLAMVSTAEKISLGKVAALRLVERSAIVLEAIEQTIIQHEGQLLPGMLEHVNKLLAHLHQNNQFLVKLSERSFLKLYLHSDEIDRRLSAANEDLSDFVDIFHLQAQISLAAWEEQSRVDREEDMRILLRKLDEARETDEKILESQQDIINTLQKITLTANSTTQVEQNRSNRLTVTASESTELSYTTATEGEIPEEQR